MSNKPTIEQPQQKNMNEILEIIPKREGLIETDEDVRRMIDYLKNPCVIEVKYRRPDGTIIEPGSRFALKLRTRYENTPAMGIGFKGIDYDVLGWFTLSELLSGEKRGHYNESDEILTYIGRLNDIQNSDNPPKRSDLFEHDIKMLFGNVEEL